MLKAAHQLAAAPSTRPVGNSKVPPTVFNSSILTTSLPTETTAAVVTVPDFAGPKKREAELFFVVNCPQPTEFRSWKMSYESEVSHSSQNPRAAVLKN